jgi:type III secretion system needle length determinant
MSSSINNNNNSSIGSVHKHSDSSSNSPKSNVDSNDQGRFESALDDKQGKEKEPTGQEGQNAQNLFSNMANSMLKGMGTKAEQAASTAQTNAAEQINEIADQILVSKPKPGEAQEVRITLKDSVLADTEVRMVKTDEGLQVDFVTKNINSNHFLQDNQKSLQDRLGDSVTVNVQYNEQGNNDGRSRQQRDMYDEMEGEE